MNINSGQFETKTSHQTVCVRAMQTNNNNENADNDNSNKTNK